MISDGEGVYMARRWRRGSSSMDAEHKAELFAWVRSMAPSRLTGVLSLDASAADAVEAETS